MSIDIVRLDLSFQIKDIRNWLTQKAVYLNPEKPQELADDFQTAL